MARSEIDQLIADCELRESRLTEWEQNFIDSIKARQESGKGLTDKQMDTLSSIWEKATERG